MFRYSTLSGPKNAVVPSMSDLLDIARGLPKWDAVILVADGTDYPRADLTWHDGHGFVLQCFEDGQSWGFFLAEPGEFSEPEIEIEMGGQALEKWPRQLFVGSEFAREALEAFLADGRQKPALRWVRTDGGFPRQIVWDERGGREAWEKQRRESGGT